MTGKNRINNLISLALAVLFLVGCATTNYQSFDYDYSILDIQKAVSDNLPQGVGAVNSNGRVFYSKKFTVNQEKKGQLPLIMRIIINGDRRPYSLDVEVRKVSPKVANIEESFDLGTGFFGQDSLAKRVVTRVDDQLAQRRKNKNIFDDFKAF